MKDTPKWPLLDKIPVNRGPMLWAVVFTTFTAPMIAVRLSAGKAAARNAERGATSMFWVQARRIKKVSARGRLDGTEMRARQIADGR